MRLLGLAVHLRSWDLTVVEEPGWLQRGADFPAKPKIVVAHHTATPQTARGDYPSMRIVRDGRADLPGPLSQIGLGRNGTVYVIAGGKANHAGRGAWQGISSSAQTIGVEAESPGDGTWTTEQRRVYPLLCAALLNYLGSPASLLCGHREWALPAGRKPDPVGIDMPSMRAQVADLLTARNAPKPTAQTTPTPAPQEDDMYPVIIGCAGNPALYVTDDYIDRRHVTDAAELKELLALGLQRKTISPALMSRLREVKL